MLYPLGISCLDETGVEKKCTEFTVVNSKTIETRRQSQELEFRGKFLPPSSHFTTNAQSSVTLKRNHFSFKIHYILVADLFTNGQLRIDFCRMLWKVGAGTDTLWDSQSLNLSGKGVATCKHWKKSRAHRALTSRMGKNHTARKHEKICHKDPYFSS